MTQRCAVTQMKRIFARTKRIGGGRTWAPSPLSSLNHPSSPVARVRRFPLFLSLHLSAWKCATCSKSFRERLKFVGRSSGSAAPLHSVVTSMVEQACKHGDEDTGDDEDEEIRFQGYLGIAARSHRLLGYRLWLLTPSRFN